jgi:hypothetical protein
VQFAELTIFARSTVGAAARRALNQDAELNASTGANSLVDAAQIPTLQSRDRSEPQ